MMGKGIQRKHPLPLHMLDVLNAYQATGRVASVYPYKGTISLNGFPGIPYETAYQRMREVVRAEAETPLGKKGGETNGMH